MIERRSHIGNDIDIYEHPGPVCEIADPLEKESIAISSIEDAKAVISSLQRFIDTLEKHSPNTGGELSR